MRQFSRMLQEQQAEDVGLVVAAVDRPAQDVRRRPEVLLELRDAQRLPGRARWSRGWSRWSCGWSWRRRRVGCLVVAPRDRRRRHEAGDEICLPAAGILQTQRPAKLLQAIPREIRENLVHPSPARTGERIDELRLDAEIGDRQFVVVDVRSELLGGQSGKNGTLRWHGPASPLLPNIVGRRMQRRRGCR